VPERRRRRGVSHLATADDPEPQAAGRRAAPARAVRGGPRVVRRAVAPATGRPPRELRAPSSSTRTRGSISSGPGSCSTACCPTSGSRRRSRSVRRSPGAPASCTSRSSWPGSP
jgi:hypothetical protein